MSSRTIGGAIGAANEVMALGGKAGAIGAEKEAITPVAWCGELIR